MKKVVIPEQLQEQIKQQLEIEQKYQKQWEQEKIFEANVDDRKKYLVTVPYSYANGLLHAGHLFTISKQEFSCGFHRMLNENVMQVAAFHCTGQPICGAAIKLKNEIEKYGWPPKVEQEQNKQEQKEVKQQNEDKIPDAQHKSQKTKLQEKSSAQPQYAILQELGVPNDKIPEFVDPETWVRYFPVEALHDLQHFGLRADYRRVFTTTESNPVYDKFIQWQFNRLYKGGKISFGKRNCIWSPIDKQVCMDHDRSVGEGLGVQEWCCLKCKINQQNVEQNEILKQYSKYNIYMICATLRPETMIGQTNIWVKPDATYEIVKASEQDLFICCHHATEELSYQEMNNNMEQGQIEILDKIQGQQLINFFVKTPLIEEEIPVLPLLTINTEKATGCVTSVPSDAPDDYIALKDLKNNVQNVRDKYHVKQEILDQIKIRDIIEIPGIGISVAAKLCEEQKVKNQHDTNKLKQIKEVCYQKGFYDGILIDGPFKGQKVQECKLKCRDMLVQQKEAFIYAEPEGEIISRSGCKCVAAKTEQYFVNYGDEEWKKQAHEAMKLVNTYGEEVKNQFHSIIDWLQQWPLSRTFGLGSKLPFDKKYLIESLSDSTIYNAMYTIADTLQQGDIYGSKCPFKYEELSDDFFDYVFDLMEDEKQKQFLDKFSEEKQQLLKHMRQEFMYFYPTDLRVSGKDLVGNHLTFYIFTHIAIWQNKPQYWPRGIRVNGHLMLNGEKMSKSTGNFLTARQCIDTFSSDGTRLAMAEAGDGRDDANFETQRAVILFKQLQDIKENMKQDMEKYNQSEEEISRPSKIFLGQIYNAAQKMYKYCDNCLFKETLIILMKYMPQYREQYIHSCNEMNIQPSKDILRKFIMIFTQFLSVFCPHTAEYINYEILGNKDTIFHQYINIDEINQIAKQYALDLAIYNYIQQSIERLKQRKDDLLKVKKGKGKQPQQQQQKVFTKGVVYCAREYEEWKVQIMNKAHELFDQQGFLDSKSTGVILAYATDVMKLDPKLKKQAIKFITDLIALSKIDQDNAFLTKLPFDEKNIYSEYSFMICKALGIKEIQCYYIGEGPVSPDQCSAAAPSRPIVFFE